MNKHIARQIISIYDNLIQRASFNIDRKIKVEWGNWGPSQAGLETLISRRDKLKKGV